ncbi:hypothetical protein Taro_034725 [Colocasia esculenta]|uniref:Uncharacterized protein n=1 Tax=Colocasia esculenta TaxID=4460 RepID=A0A843WAX6_COLES|nr:hypothetical protein [Colocasia esculenta]
MSDYDIVHGDADRDGRGGRGRRKNRRREACPLKFLIHFFNYPESPHSILAPVELFCLMVLLPLRSYSSSDSFFGCLGWRITASSPSPEREDSFFLHLFAYPVVISLLNQRVVRTCSSRDVARMSSRKMQMDIAFDVLADGQCAASSSSSSGPIRRRRTVAASSSCSTQHRRSKRCSLACAATTPPWHKPHPLESSWIYEV